MRQSPKNCLSVNKIFLETSPAQCRQRQCGSTQRLTNPLSHRLNQLSKTMKTRWVMLKILVLASPVSWTAWQKQKTESKLAMARRATQPLSSVLGSFLTRYNTQEIIIQQSKKRTKRQKLEIKAGVVFCLQRMTTLWRYSGKAELRTANTPQHSLGKDRIGRLKS